LLARAAGQVNTLSYFWKKEKLAASLPQMLLLV
jgi:hypothetical protein